MEETLKAYLAGIVDGEGCIGIQWNKNSVAHSLRIEIGMTNKPIIQFIADSLGGEVHQLCKPRGNRREGWEWRVFSNRALEVLELLLPYLRVKRPQALLGIRFRKEWKDQTRGQTYKRGHPRCSSEEFEKRQKYYYEMHELNSVGKEHI